jgi:hypothetical protein
LGIMPNTVGYPVQLLTDFQRSSSNDRQTMNSKVTGSTFERNKKIAERFHDNGLDCCYVHHDYDKALSELRLAIRMREGLFGPHHNDTAVSYFRLASVLVEAKKEYFEALVVSRRYA